MKDLYSKAKEVTIEINGKRVTGRYAVHNKMVTVWYDMKETTTQIGSSTPESIARMLLSEIVNKS